MVTVETLIQWSLGCKFTGSAYMMMLVHVVYNGDSLFTGTEQ